MSPLSRTRATFYFGITHCDTLIKTYTPKLEAKAQTLLQQLATEPLPFASNRRLESVNVVRHNQNRKHAVDAGALPDPDRRNQRITSAHTRRTTTQHLTRAQAHTRTGPEPVLRGSTTDVV